MSATVRLAAAFPEARRMADFLERDFGDEGVAVSLIEGSDTWLIEAWFRTAIRIRRARTSPAVSAATGFQPPCRRKRRK